MLLEGCLVGTAEVTLQDKGMNVMGGRFHPGPAYPEVCAVFQSFAAACEDPAACTAYDEARDGLCLQVRDEHGRPVDRVVHILDFRAEVEGSDVTDLEIVLLPR